MQKDTVKKTFDIQERDRMRSSLLRYMQENRIGVPSLQVRIAHAAGRSVDLIPLKTLQRFLAHSHRTNDSFLIPVYQFSADLPVREENASIGQILARFFGGVAKEETAEHDARAGLSGSFAVFVEKDPPKVLGRKDKPFRARKSNLSARSDERRGVSVLVEEVLLKDDGGPVHKDSEFRHRYEGFALDHSAPIIALLRNVLTGFPKSYWLYPDGQRFYGYVSARGLNEPDGADAAARQPRTVIVEVASPEDEEGREGREE